ncbi:MAG TPA: TolC family protein, partial [Steroidobacteraceae bacterium]|nr:TolC family protein [Steroidobacteraceae bacterium]
MRNVRFLLAPLAAAVLAACAVGPNYQPPETKAAEKFDQLEATYSADQGNAQFWQTFADSELDKLVSEALASNHDLRIALTRVYEARALRRDAAFDLAPSINVGGGYTKTRSSNAVTPNIARDAELYDAGFDAFWELDFFGGVRRGLEASKADLGAEEAALQDVQVIVTAEVTRTYFELRG